VEPDVFSSYRQWLEHEKMPKGKKSALVAALALFSEQGFDGTSTVQVAEKAGISQATIFKYFHTKQDLLLAIVEPVMENFFPHYRDEFFDGIRACETLPEMVSFMIHDRYAFITGNKEAIKILAMEMMISQEMRDLFGKLLAADDFNFLAELLKMFRETGELRDDIDAPGIIRIIAGQLMGFIIESNFAPGIMGDRQLDLQLISEQIVRTISK